MNNIQTHPIVGNVLQTIQTFIDPFEGYSSLAYWDTANPAQPTIGLGTNLNVRSYFELVVQDLYGTSVNGYGFFLAFQSGLRSFQPTSQAQLQSNQDGYNGELQALLKKLATQFAGPSAQPFQLTPTQQSLIEMQILSGFTVGGQTFPGAIVKLQNQLQAEGINIPSNTVEFEALVSMYYNNPNLIGQNLLNALGTNGNRAKAWYDIRYGSNAGKSLGIANRRVAESDLFGLYNETGPFPVVPVAEAISVLQMYTANRATIQAYETTINNLATSKSPSPFKTNSGNESIQSQLIPAQATLIVTEQTAYPFITQDINGDVLVGPNNGEGKKMGSDSIYDGFLRSAFGQWTGAAVGERGHCLFKPVAAQDPGLIGRVSNLSEVGVL